MIDLELLTDGNFRLLNIPGVGSGAVPTYTIRTPFEMKVRLLGMGFDLKQADECARAVSAIRPGTSMEIGDPSELNGGH